MPSAYATIADMQARFAQAELVQLTDDERTGAIVTTRVQTALDQADSVIDGYVAAYYRRADAASPIPPLLTDIACDIARYRLFRHGSPTEHVKNVHDERMRQLRDIASGKLKLDLGEETLQPRDGQILVDSADRHFTRDSMKGF